MSSTNPFTLRSLFDDLLRAAEDRGVQLEKYDVLFCENAKLRLMVQDRDTQIRDLQKQVGDLKSSLAQSKNEPAEGAKFEQRTLYAVARFADWSYAKLSHGKIGAIKEVREVTGYGLNEAKDIVDRLDVNPKFFPKQDLTIPEKDNLFNAGIRILALTDGELRNYTGAMDVMANASTP